MFLPHLYTREGFRLAKQKYVAGEDTVNLPPDRKRVVTICNLFSNQNKQIDQIARLLDTDHRAVILALIQEGLVLDRRRSKGRQQRQDRRQ
jgi:hypothetical protein